MGAVVLGLRWLLKPLSVRNLSQTCNGSVSYSDFSLGYSFPYRCQILSGVFRTMPNYPISPRLKAYQK